MPPKPPNQPGAEPVIRIPVAGPKPFNTLVVVRETISYGPGPWPSDGNVYRSPSIFETSFSLIGYDPRVDVPFTHSTTVVMYWVQLSDDTSFLVAYDAATAAFDDRGCWIVTTDDALASDGEYYLSMAAVSSWVLCYEPPPPPSPWDEGDDRFRRVPTELAHRATSAFP
jgi:hypothetical protein